MITEIKNRIRALVQKYEQGKEVYRTSRFNETQVRNEFLDPLFEILGWDIRNSAGKSTNEREVLLEEGLKADAFTNSKKPDYTFRLFGERKFFLEAKKPCVHIEREDDPAKQVRRYGFTAGLKISVLSNFEHLYIYDTSYPVEKDDTHVKAIVREYKYTDYENKAEELLELLGKESVYSGHFDEVWGEIKGNANPRSVDKLFLEQINKWRLLLGNEIIKSMPDIEIDYLGDVVQSYINKILFLRVCEDRNIEIYQVLLRIADSNSHKELVAKFREADNRYNSGLFEELLSEDIIGNVSSSFWKIIRQLYFPESPYSFAVLSSDILGKIYEIFLAQHFAVEEGKLTLVKKPENKHKDIVTTPNFIVKEILIQTMNAKLKTMSDEEILDIKCVDIACGSGVFLLETFQLLCDRLIDYYLETNPEMLIQVGINTYKLPFKIKRNVLSRCIFGVDIDLKAVEACRFGLLLKLLEDEDNHTLSSFHPILPDLQFNIEWGNSLLSRDEIGDNDPIEVNAYNFTKKFDFIVGNPPYMKTEDIKEYLRTEYDNYENVFVSADGQYDKYFLFLERGIKLLKEGGTLGYILPNKFMKVKSARQLRNFLTGTNTDGSHYVKSIITFGSNLIFEKKSTYTCIFIAENCNHTNYLYSEVRNLNAWKARETKSRNAYVRDTKELTASSWNPVTDEQITLREKIMACSIELNDIVVNSKDYIINGIQTSWVKGYIIKPTREDEDFYYFKVLDKEWQIEKGITKPYYETEHGLNALNTYRTLSANARVIYPYRKKNGEAKLLSVEELQKEFPKALQYFIAHRDRLLQRSFSAGINLETQWYCFGRTQKLTDCDAPIKIIVGNMSNGDKYAIDKKQITVSAGGTAGYSIIILPKHVRYSIYYIQAILNSVQDEWFAMTHGEFFRGNYIARGTKLVGRLPICKIDFNKPEEVFKHDDIVKRQKKLIELGDKIAEAHGNKRKIIPLQRQFDAVKEEQQSAINALFGMTDEEVALIPRIKDYAAD